jgi:hypothetical protein
MLRQSIFIALTACCCALSAQTYTQITEARGTYPLDFNTIYETTASLDVETAVTLPEGYIFKLQRPGTVDFINSFVMQNVLFFTRTIDHRFDNTAIVCNVETPTKEVRQLVFKIKGGPNQPCVYAIHFVAEQGTNRDIEAVKQRYEHQMNLAIADKEKETAQSVRKNTLSNSLPLFLTVTAEI